MNVQSHILGIGSGLIAIFLATSPMAAGDADRGEALAKQWCASCHAIGHATVQADTPPAFTVIVGERGRDANWISAWLVAPHQNMPDLSLTGREIDDLVAYMESLRPAE